MAAGGDLPARAPRLWDRDYRLPLRRQCFGTTTALALMQERPPFSLALPQRVGQRSLTTLREKLAAQETLT